MVSSKFEFDSCVRALLLDFPHLLHVKGGPLIVFCLNFYISKYHMFRLLDRRKMPALILGKLQEMAVCQDNDMNNCQDVMYVRANPHERNSFCLWNNMYRV